MRLVSGVGLIAGVVLAGAGTYLLLTTSSNEGARGEPAPALARRSSARNSERPIRHQRPRWPAAAERGWCAPCTWPPEGQLLFGACLLSEYRVVEDGGARRGGAGGASGRGAARPRVPPAAAARAVRRPGRPARWAAARRDPSGGAGGVNATGGTGGAVTGVGGTTAGTGGGGAGRGGSDRQRWYRGHRRPRRYGGMGGHGGGTAGPRRHDRHRREQAAARPGGAEPPAWAASREQEAAGPRLDGRAELVAVDRRRLSVRPGTGPAGCPRRTATTPSIWRRHNETLCHLRHDERHRGQFRPASRAGGATDLLPIARARSAKRFQE